MIGSISAARTAQAITEACSFSFSDAKDTVELSNGDKLNIRKRKNGGLSLYHLNAKTQVEKDVPVFMESINPCFSSEQYLQKTIHDAQKADAIVNDPSFREIHIEVSGFFHNETDHISEGEVGSFVPKDIVSQTFQAYPLVIGDMQKQDSYEFHHMLNYDPFAYEAHYFFDLGGHIGDYYNQAVVIPPSVNLLSDAVSEADIAGGDGISYTNLPQKISEAYKAYIASLDPYDDIHAVSLIRDSGESVRPKHSDVDCIELSTPYYFSNPYRGGDQSFSATYEPFSASFDHFMDASHKQCPHTTSTSPTPAPTSGTSAPTGAPNNHTGRNIGLGVVGGGGALALVGLGAAYLYKTGQLRFSGSDGDTVATKDDIGFGVELVDMGKKAIETVRETCLV